MNPATKNVPILVDNTLNRFLAVKYGVYSCFGISGVIVHVPSLSIVAGDAVAMLLAGIVAVSAALASISAWNSARGGKWDRRELLATIVMVSFVAVYNIALIYLTVIGEGNRINLAILATALLVMPIWRLTDIIKRSKVR